MSGLWNTVKDGWDTVKDTASDIGDKVGGTDTDPGLFGTAKRKTAIADPSQGNFWDPNSGKIAGELQDRRAAIDARTAPQAGATRIGQLERIGAAQGQVGVLSDAERIAAAQINQAQDAQTRGMQMGLLAQLQDQASGNGVGQDLAAQAYRKATEQSLRGSMALAATAGAPAALAARGIADQNAAVNAANAQALSTDKMNAALASQGLLGQLSGAARGQDQSMAMTQAQLEQQARMTNANAGNEFNMARFNADNAMSQFNAGMRQDSSKFNAGAANTRTMTQADMDQQLKLANMKAELESRGLNDAQIRDLLDDEMTQYERDRQGNIEYEKLLNRARMGKDSAEQQAWDNASSNRQAVVKGVGEAIEKGAQAASSDERGKMNIQSLSSEEEKKRIQPAGYSASGAGLGMAEQAKIAGKSVMPQFVAFTKKADDEPVVTQRQRNQRNIIDAGGAFGGAIGAIAKGKKPGTQSDPEQANDMIEQMRQQLSEMQAPAGPEAPYASREVPSVDSEYTPGMRSSGGSFGDRPMGRMGSPRGIAGDLNPDVNAIAPPDSSTITPGALAALKESVAPEVSAETGSAGPSFSLSSKKEKTNIESASRDSKAPSEDPGKYDTKLSPEQEAIYNDWKNRNAPKDSGADYDLRGAFAAGEEPAANGHWVDTYKKPNHPTFSDQSQYAVGEDYKKAGHWDGETYVPAEEQFKRDAVQLKKAEELSNRLKAMFGGKSAVNTEENRPGYSLSSEDEKTNVQPLADPYANQNNNSNTSSQPKMSQSDFANNGGGAFGPAPSNQPQRQESGYSPYQGDRSSTFGNDKNAYINQLQEAQGPAQPQYTRAQRSGNYNQGTPGLTSDVEQQKGLLNYLQRMTAENEANRKRAERAAAEAARLKAEAEARMATPAPAPAPVAPPGDIAPVVVKDENYYGDKYAHPYSRDAQSMASNLPDRRYQLANESSQSYGNASAAYKAATVGMPAAVGGMGSQDPNDPNAVFPTGPGGALETVAERKKREDLESWVNSSDERGKERKQYSGSGNDLLEEFISKLKPSTYVYKDPDAPLAGEGDQLGVMAQDLQKSRVGRSAVEKDENGRLVVNYGKLAGQNLAVGVEAYKKADRNEEMLKQLLASRGKK